MDAMPRFIHSGEYSSWSVPRVESNKTYSSEHKTHSWDPSRDILQFVVTQDNNKKMLIKCFACKFQHLLHILESFCSLIMGRRRNVIKSSPWFLSFPILFIIISWRARKIVASGFYEFFLEGAWYCAHWHRLWTDFKPKEQWTFLHCMKKREKRKIPIFILMAFDVHTNKRRTQSKRHFEARTEAPEADYAAAQVNLSPNWISLSCAMLMDDWQGQKSFFHGTHNCTIFQCAEFASLEYARAAQEEAKASSQNPTQCETLCTIIIHPVSTTSPTQPFAVNPLRAQTQWHALRIWKASPEKKRGKE